MKKVINTELAPKAIGPYSQAIMIGNFLFTSGQIPIDPKTGDLVYGDDVIVTQTHQCMRNIENILECEKMTFGNVIKTTIFITDMNNFNKVNSAYAEYCGKTFPARSCVEISKLPRGALVEVEVIACK
ncbi:2-iminobutanoate/2-iminopropanoate deaminase [Clostridium tetanomorphum]|uniref:RidA family protein n=1 Tax=Clostridium tetanomorphum TaxID=1553 RepID=A0A923EA67_CLOTT|nr:RidA family protein [Clostridium tetanomorphum]KAJ49959.1 translation initiation inhibitor [Clostridium tetanomorphum DSM 665]MBC2399285.1 RidA family protein [Clostridium tetanomorphum]MBP1866089.1 2-iminobutanoate/2-iminopropanoate deaminase [Clostridium tetanomorphum]NRS86717.1 2-iminobutanoate/2-iminopropanoate deaminase [Clostridium tetanomorphum]NRZ99530.1 2-iminobutanoate/2-iminopropanoate deaminase [Clostridium tetanomorphum]